jgi:hypothetical protein
MMIFLPKAQRLSFRIPLSLLTVAVVTVALTSSAPAQNLAGRNTRAEISIKAGLISGMDMTGSRDLNTGVGASLQLGAGFPVGSGFYIPVTFDFHNITISRENQLMIVPSVGLKRGIYFPQSEITLRPGGSIGFGYLSDQGDLRASQYLTYKIAVEAVFKMDKRRSWLGELAYFNAPTGSSGADDVELGPGFLLRFGIIFK